MRKTGALFKKRRITQSDRRMFLFIAEEFECSSSSYTRDFTELRKIGLLEENVGQVSGKHNKYQESFI